MNAKRSSDPAPAEQVPTGQTPTEHPDLAWGRGRTSTPDEVGEALQELLGVASDVRPALARRMGIGVNDLRALEHLIRGPIGPAEIAHRLDLTTAATTVLLDRLEQAGHVVREPHPTDARRRVVRLTDSGWVDALAQVRPMVELLDVPSAALGPGDREVVVRYLRAVTEALRQTVEGEAGRA